MRALRLKLILAVGAGKAREQQGAEDGEAEKTDQGLDGDQEVGRSRVRGELAVADSGEGLDAEEEAVLKARERRGGGAGERVGAGQPVQRCEQEVGGEVADSHEGEQARDWKREKRVIGVVGMERAQVVAADVEGAVAIEQANTTALRELAAEAEVLVEPFLLR